MIMSGCFCESGDNRGYASKARNRGISFTPWLSQVWNDDETRNRFSGFFFWSTLRPLITWGYVGRHRRNSPSGNPSGCAEVSQLYECP
jgi:hypothetical protein